ncbi:unnamed protein product [Adineta steineri]|uniref:EGF-like domain-containing protein n=1 Tax=Adineta steineri TaxID=433720 RepID=A0A820CPZ7_9BILA|nr:unnamed protein product [Adineta steineri]
MITIWFLFYLLAICSQPCSNGGSCTGPNFCTCTSSWTGFQCETPSPIIYSQSFVASYISGASSQCTAWLTFQSQLVSRPYTSMTIKGTNNPTGITLTNSAYVLGLATALRTNTPYGPVFSDGYLWAVGLCGGFYELTTTGSVCQCNTGYTLRPCIGNGNWGAINGHACGASSQTMTVIFR